MSTERAEHQRIEREEGLRYAVCAPVRVRKEAFGLLFYNTEESRLTFVKSGDLLRIETSALGGKIIFAGVRPETRSKVRKLIDDLLTKRLICDS